jgi:hypothetical protein
MALKNMSIFLAQQRIVADNKKMRVDSFGELFLEKILDYIYRNKVAGPEASVNLNAIVTEWKEKGVALDVASLEQSVKLGLMGEIFAGKNGDLSTTLQVDKLKTYYPPMKLLNVIDKFNSGRTK